MRATEGTLRFATVIRDRQQLALQVVAATIVFALAVGLFLLQRRFAGALSTPLSAPQLIAVGAILTVWTVAVRKLSHATPALTALAFIAILLIALACSYPGSRIIDWLVWPTVIFAAALFPLNFPLAATRSEACPTDSPPALDPLDAEPEHVLQQITRIRNVDGTEAIRATLAGEFETGERQTTLYIAFCPPFERLPQVEVEVADDLNATVKLTQVLHNGAQIEVRLAEPAEEFVRVALELFATDSSQT